MRKSDIAVLMCHCPLTGGICAKIGQEEGGTVLLGHCPLTGGTCARVGQKGGVK